MIRPTRQLANQLERIKFNMLKRTIEIQLIHQDHCITHCGIIDIEKLKAFFNVEEMDINTNGNEERWYKFVSKEK